MFEACIKRKFQIEIRNIPGLHEALGRQCYNPKTCSRTGVAHDKYEHQAVDGKVVQFGTAGTAEYPKELCSAIAKYLVFALQKKQVTSTYSFVEVFSGPNVF